LEYKLYTSVTVTLATAFMKKGATLKIIEYYPSVREYSLKLVSAILSKEEYTAQNMG